MAPVPDAVYSLLRSPEGLVLAAHMVDDAPGAGWSLPAGPLEGTSHRRSAERWCRRLLGVRVTAGELLSVMLPEDGAARSASRFCFDAWTDEALPAEFTALAGQVTARFFPALELLDLLSPSERDVLEASLCALEHARMVEWSPQGEVRFRRPSAGPRMMPTLPRPFGPLQAQEPSRGARHRVSRKR